MDADIKQLSAEAQRLVLEASRTGSGLTVSQAQAKIQELADIAVRLAAAPQPHHITTEEAGTHTVITCPKCGWQTSKPTLWAVPEGWRLVPKEATPEMIAAYWDCIEKHAGERSILQKAADRYSAMIAATPPAPSAKKVP